MPTASKRAWSRQTGLSYEWTGDAYVGPPTTKTFDDPPIGHLLEHFNGRIYVANGCTIWYSEPFAYAWFNMAENFIPLASRVRMIRAVRGGLFVSTEEKTIFLPEAAPRSSRRQSSRITRPSRARTSSWKGREWRAAI